MDLLRKIQFVLIGFSSCLHGIERIEPPLHLTISVAIPCHFVHFPFLENLISLYEEQTILPDEIVISLSEVDKVSPHELLSLETRPRPFILKVIKSSSRLSAGRNRSIATEQSSGDLILCQDADDLPHPQRVEILKYLFEHHKIDFLVHSFASSEEEIFPYEKEQIPLQVATVSALQNDVIPLHNGNVALRRKIIQRMSWDFRFRGGEDFSFNERVISAFESCYITPWKLIEYRVYLSSFGELQPTPIAKSAVD